MNYVDDLENFVKLLHSRPEIILFPLGQEGGTALDWLKYSELTSRICCLAVAQVPGETAQIFERGLPLIPVKFLPHFRETAIFLVAAPKDLHAQIHEELTAFGFQAVVCLGENLLATFREEIKNFANSGKMLLQFMNHVTKELEEMKYRIAEQNEVCRTNEKTFSEYRNCFRGKKVVIVATGPTLKNYEPMKGAIHIGLNRAWLREDISVDYLFAQDNAGNQRSEIKTEDGFDRIKKKIFLGRHLDRVSCHWINFSEDFYLRRENIFRFYLNSNDDFMDQPIYRDITTHSLADFGSVVFPALQFALFTYPKEIYLAGCDTSHAGYFYGQSQLNQVMQTHSMKVGYARMKMFAKLFYPETEIISLNPVGLKGLFRDVYTEPARGGVDDSSPK